MPFETKTANLPSGPLSYMVAGEGQPLLYIHAAGGPMLTPFLTAMAERRRVFIPITPGFMGTPRLPGVDTMQQVAAVAAAFAEEQFGEPVDVMGASFGGYEAMWLAVLRPDLVKQLVLEAPAGLRFGMTEASLSPEAARANLFAYPEKAKGLTFPPEVMIANSKTAHGYMGGVMVDEALAARIGEITARVLVLMATRDITIPIETGRFLAEKCRSAHVTYIYDAAHALEVDQPQATFRVVTNFLERGPAFIVAESRTAL